MPVISNRHIILHNYSTWLKGAGKVSGIVYERGNSGSKL